MVTLILTISNALAHSTSLIAPMLGSRLFLDQAAIAPILSRVPHTRRSLADERTSSQPRADPPCSLTIGARPSNRCRRRWTDCAGSFSRERDHSAVRRTGGSQRPESGRSFRAQTERGSRGEGRMGNVATEGECAQNEGRTERGGRGGGRRRTLSLVTLSPVHFATLQG